MSIASSLRRQSTKKFSVKASPVSEHQPLQNTYWNGEPTPARKVVVKVGKVLRASWWCGGMEGTLRDAVEVNYCGQIFFLDDQDGHRAWLKVTKGGGGPEWGHYSLPDDSEVVRERE